MKYLDDFEPGFSATVGAYQVTEDEVLSFARAYDPQPMHIDKAFAQSLSFGGLIASGWHSCAIAMRLLVDHFMDGVAVIASPGVDEIRWKLPVRPGDVLRLRWTILDVRHSASKPDRGIVRAFSELLNQKNDVVLTIIGMSLIHVRPQPRP